MKNRLLLLMMILTLTIQCRKSAAHDDEHDAEDLKPKIQFTAYSEHHELYAESDIFVEGKPASFLAHFTKLSDFKPLSRAKISLALKVNDHTVLAEQAGPIRPGIYLFSIVPKFSGKGQLLVNIGEDDRLDQIILKTVTIYKNEADALNKHREPPANAQAVLFTKEKSWKVEFATELPLAGAFGQIIKTTAQIQSAQGDEAIITAKANGVIVFDGDVLEGKSLTSGQSLFMISAGGITENNLAVRFSEAQNNFRRAKAEYERSKDLARDKIVAEKDFLKIKNEYDNAKLIFDNLNRNFSGGGQRVVTPFAGFIKQIFVNNGQFVNAGQPIVTVSQNRTFLLRADVQQKYAPVLASIVSATIRTLHDNQTYSLEQLNGKILSYGRNVNNDNYLIPISIQIENKGGLLSGGFVELHLKTMINANKLSIPNTSILEEQGKYFVYVQVNPENFEKREVTLGASDGLRTEIITGIDENDRFVSKGAIWVKLAQASGALDAHSGHVH